MNVGIIRPVSFSWHPKILWASVLGVVICGNSMSANLVFSEDFDDQPDWHSGLLINNKGSNLSDNLYDHGFGSERIDMYQREGTHTIPEGWYSVRQGEQYFSPRNGFEDAGENIEILAANADKALGGKGKSAVFWRESHQNNSHEWNSDGILLKHFPEGFDELYVEFWITFDPNTTTDSAERTNGNSADGSKIFRMDSWNTTGSEYQAFEGGALGPILVWGWSQNQWGVRNGVTMRGGPHGENYRFSGEDLAGMPTVGNFVKHVVGHGFDVETEWPVDRANGGRIIDNVPGGIADHSQVYGDRGQWSKLAFYVKMNSEIGKKDGIFIQWLNGRRVFHFDGIPWVQENESNKMVKWNTVAFGGNDYFHSYPIEMAVEEWYSIDNIKVYDSIPVEADRDIDFNSVRPNPPSSLITN